jgi:hypothetical protein
MAQSYSDRSDEPEIYFSEDFDFDNFKQTYNDDVDDLRAYVDRCEKNRDVINCAWEGKSSDLKKGEGAFPHEGASDTEVFLVKQKIRNNDALRTNALRKSTIRAYPRESSDVDRSAEVSVFLRWLRDNGIPNFQQEMELSGYYGDETGLMVTYCGWRAKKQSYLKLFDIDQIAETLPELAEIWMDEDRVDEAMELFNSVEGWELNEARVKKALRQLRKSGVAEIPVTVKENSEADVRTLMPDADVILPAYTVNYQDAPRIHIRMLMSAQEILNRVSSEGWDEEWANYVIENHRGIDQSKFYNPNSVQSYRRIGRIARITNERARDTIEVALTFERLIDDSDNAEGIYLTVWCPEMTEQVGTPNVAKRVLLSGRKNYPVVITKTSLGKTLYDGITLPELLRAPQKNQKTLRDSYMDESGWSISPTIWAPAGVDASGMGPGAVISGPTGRKPEYIDRPSSFAPNLNLEKLLVDEANQIAGQDPNDPLSVQLQQHNIGQYLSHVQNVLKMTYETWKLDGPEELFLRVTGNPEPVQFTKKEDEGEMDITVSFNSTYDDPEKVEKMLAGLYQVLQNDQGGRVNSEAITDMALSALDPTLADLVLMPTEQGSAKIVNETTNDIAKMAAGIPVGAPQNAGQARLQIVQDYKQSQTGAMELQSKPQFQFLLAEYEKQLTFQLQQLQNAEIGKVGAQPAQMGGTVTQGMNE